MTIKLYSTNITGSQITIGNQRKLKHILETNKIDYVDIDVSDPKNISEKEFLQRQLSSMNKKFCLPQLFNGDQYCCDFDDLLLAVESNTLKDILKLDNK